MPNSIETICENITAMNNNSCLSWDAKFRYNKRLVTSLVNDVKKETKKDGIELLLEKYNMSIVKFATYCYIEKITPKEMNDLQFMEDRIETWTEL